MSHRFRPTCLALALGLSAALEKGTQVINLSLGGPPDRLIARLIDAAVARRVAVVAAVGWAVTTTAGIGVDLQFTIFGSSGALVATASKSCRAALK